MRKKEYCVFKVKHFIQQMQKIQEETIEEDQYIHNQIFMISSTTLGYVVYLPASPDYFR